MGEDLKKDELTKTTRSPKTIMTETEVINEINKKLEQMDKIVDSFNNTEFKGSFEIFPGENYCKYGINLFDI